MKTVIQYLQVMLATSLLFVACQDVEEPSDTIPTVTTNKVSGVGLSYAVVSGTVSTKSDCRFLLSTHQDLSDATDIVARCTNEEEGTYLAELSQLVPNTTYYVALCASDGYSDVRGNVQEFKTASCLTIASVTLADWETGEPEPFLSDVTALFYSLTNDGMVYDGTSTIKYSNGWYMSPNRVYGFGGQIRRVYAYRSIQESIKDVTGIHLYANKYDFVYGSSEVLSEDTPDAHIALKHAMAKVTFELKKASDSSSDYVVSDVNLRNSRNKEVNAIKFDCYLNLFTEEMSEGIGYGHDGLFISGLQMELSASEPQSVSFYVIPNSFNDNEAQLCLYPKDNKSKNWVTDMGGATWLAGKQYTYPVTVTSSGLQIGDVIVEEWQNNEEGSVIIKK